MSYELMAIFSFGFSIGFILIKSHFDTLARLDKIHEVLSEMRFDLDRISFRLDNGFWVKQTNPTEDK